MAKQIETLTIEEDTLNPRSREKYLSHLKRFDAWRGNRDITDMLVAEYLVYMFEKGLAPKTADLSIAAIRWRAESEDQPNPCGKKTKGTLRSYRVKGRERGYGQAEGVMWEQADAVVSLALQDYNIFGLRDAAIIAVGSDASLRVGEIADIEVKHVKFDENHVYIPRSKTDQEGKGAKGHLGDPTLNLVRAWMDKGKITDGILFRTINKNTHRPSKKGMSDHQLRRIIKARCKAAGVEGRVSGHSLRVGSMQSMAASGMNDIQMRLAGRWKKGSDMPYHYAEKMAAKHSPIATHRTYRYGVQQNSQQSVVSHIEDEDAA